jgi:hypothetical protein
MKKSESGYYIVRYKLDGSDKISEVFVFGKNTESVRKHIISIYEIVEILSIKKQ